MQGRMMRRIFCGALAIALAAAAPAAAGDDRRQYTPGAPGLGDPYYPFAGNGGYDVRHYSLRLDYSPPDAATPPANHLDGRAVIVARATQDLSSFNLDLRPFIVVSRLRLDGRSTAFARSGEHELTVTPRKGIKEGRHFVVDVEYAGTPEAVVDPDESLEGWVPTDDGAFVVNEPQGSPGWYPVNDNPRDKATFDFTVTLPEGRTAMANGVLLGRFTRRGRTTWHWLEPHPMAPYLATATNGVFETRFGRIPDGLRVYNAVDPREASAWTVLEKQPAIVARFSELFGRYPFSNVGAIVDHAPEVGYALESQGKANYSRAPGESTVAHEIAHQWFGNAVTLEQWPDIWLNEGFARWSEWIWFEGQPGQPTAQQRFETAYATPAEETGFWNPPPGNPGGPESLFDGTIYTRGAMTLQALRQKLGDGPFFRILRAWYAENRYGNVTTADFVALSERIAGQQLDTFFDIWLYRPGKPEPGSW